MSYILEALKKSQAERQIGSAPTVHAVQAGAPVRDAATVRRWPLPIALGAIAVAAAVAAALAVGAWHFKSSAKKSAAPPPAAAHVAGPARAAAAPAPAPAAAMAAPAPAATAAVAESAPSAAAPLAVVPPSAPAEKPPVARAAPAPVHTRAPAPAITAAPPAQPPATPAVAEEDTTLQTLRQLPEPIQRSVPPLVFGGYMYSSNPADRLVLIDKTLRHEGEEVAPGLVLEKLLPKSAVMNYRGYRYRVPF